MRVQVAHDVGQAPERSTVHGATASQLWEFGPDGAFIREIGKNLYLYEYRDTIIVVDCGLAFPDETTLGVDVIVPDVDFLEQNRDRLLGIVLTHGHEDHLGAVADLWPKLEAPVYATPFAASVLRFRIDAETSVDNADSVPYVSIPFEFKYAYGWVARGTATPLLDYRVETASITLKVVAVNLGAGE